MPWMSLPTWVFGFALLGLIALVVAVIVVLRFGRRQASEELRRLALAQLSLATRRNLPLGEALLALGNDLEEAADRRSSAPGLVRLLGRLSGVWMTRYKLRRMSARLYEMAAKLREGALAPALALAPGAFPAPWPALLGEAQRLGTLGETLRALEAGESEGEHFRGLIRGQLYYPLAVLLVVQLPLVFTVLIIYPKYEEILGMLGVSGGPFQTLRSAQQWLLFLTPCLMLAAWLAPGALGSQAGRVGRALRRLPGLRGTWAALRRCRRARLLSAALRSGLSLPEALRQLASGEGDSTDTQAFAHAADLARDGVDLSGVAGPLLGSGALGLVSDGSPRVLDAAAEEAKLEASNRVGTLARWNLILGLSLVGGLVAVTYWGPFMAIQSMYAQQVPW